MYKSLKAISALLSYPSAALQKAVPELKEAVAGDPLLGGSERSAIALVADDIARLDLYDAQERYVHLFDRTRALSLHLFEHVHGESRDRGQAMVDLKAMYEAKGWDIAAQELPDFLPLFLEYLAQCERSEIHEMLGQTLHILTALKERLAKRDSAYAGLFAVLETVAGGKPDRDLLEQLRSLPEDDPDDLEALDKIWEEEAVKFGGNAGEGACGPDRLRRQIRAADRRPVDPASPAGQLGG